MESQREMPGTEDDKKGEDKPIKYPNFDDLKRQHYSEINESNEREYAITHMMERARSMRGTPHSFRI